MVADHALRLGLQSQPWPVRSGAWDNTKQNTLKTTLDTRTESSDDFREAARRTAALLGSTADSEADFSFWWGKLATLPSCHMATTFLVIISLLHMAYMTTTFQSRASKPVTKCAISMPHTSTLWLRTASNG